MAGIVLINRSVAIEGFAVAYGGFASRIGRCRLGRRHIERQVSHPLEYAAQATERFRVPATIPLYADPVPPAVNMFVLPTRALLAASKPMQETLTVSQGADKPAVRIDRIASDIRKVPHVTEPRQALLQIQLAVRPWHAIEKEMQALGLSVEIEYAGRPVSRCRRGTPELPGATVGGHGLASLAGLRLYRCLDLAGSGRPRA